jgi:hypothetical protein
MGTHTLSSSNVRQAQRLHGRTPLSGCKKKDNLERN